MTEYMEMDKNEFIEKLQRTLAGGLNSSQVAENVRYYEEYIASEIQKGKTEEEVLLTLGDPRLLAKSIIEANKRAGASYGSNQEYDEEIADDSGSRAGRSFSGGLMLPGWLLMVIITVAVIVVIGIATSLISLFAPVIIVGLVVLLIVKVFQNNTK
ncbi:MAG: DUF1700 domain-containing protein [Roseburia sp.]|nr:DUF1700 domain-containing protein [Ruminococcus sp.]MCM1156559.1 DUF1700 domain-containing protein [Roseburia sp.]MCM1241390.1 DUF1700 domain-containing protein [Roseburia sp.]